MSLPIRPRLTIALSPDNLTVDDLRLFADIATRTFGPNVPVYVTRDDDDALIIEISDVRRTRPGDE